MKKWINIENLTSIFPSKKLKEDEITGIDPEITQCKKVFCGKSWETIECEVYEFHSDALHLIDATTLLHLIPGYLRCALNDELSDISHYLVCFFESEGFDDLLRLLNKEQTEFVNLAADILRERENSIRAGKGVCPNGTKLGLIYLVLLGLRKTDEIITTIAPVPLESKDLRSLTKAKQPRKPPILQVLSHLKGA